MWIGIPPRDDGGAVDWKKWPTNKPLPDEAFSEEGLLITARAKLRPCLVLTLQEEIEAFGELHVLPLSGFQGGGFADLIKANQVPHAHFLPGNDQPRFEDATVDFRWTWRVRASDLTASRHEGDLDPETLVRLLVRYRDYLYLAAPGT